MILLCILRPCSSIFFKPSALFVFCCSSDTARTTVLSKVLIFLILHHSVHKEHLNAFKQVAFLIQGKNKKEWKWSQILEKLHWSKQTQQKYYRYNQWMLTELSGSHPHPSEHRLWLVLAVKFRREPDLESSRVFWFKVLVWSHLHSQQQDNNFCLLLFVKEVITCLGFQKFVVFLGENARRKRGFVFSCCVVLFCFYKQIKIGEKGTAMYRKLLFYLRKNNAILEHLVLSHRLWFIPALCAVDRRWNGTNCKHKYKGMHVCRTLWTAWGRNLD